MSRRVSKSIVAVFTLSVILSSTPSAFAGRTPTFGDDPSAGPVERIVRVIKKLVKPLLPQSYDDPIYQPGPPKP